jgi:hypothetical protein
VHSRPVGGISNRGDVERLAYACDALIVALSDDARVRETYASWLGAHDLEPIVARIGQRRPYDCPDPTPQDLNDILKLKAMLGESDSTDDLRALDDFVRGGLHLSYSWLPAMLLAQFRMWAYATAGGERLRLGIRPPAQVDLPVGKRPRDGGRDIARNVTWYYRARVKAPPESMGSLAKEYAASVGRNNQALSVVQNGIKQAIALLDAVVNTSSHVPK